MFGLALTLIPLLLSGASSKPADSLTVNAGAGVGRIRKVGTRWRWDVGDRFGDADTSDLAVLAALEEIAPPPDSPVLAMSTTSSWAALPDGTWWKLDRTGFRTGQEATRAQAVRAALGEPV